MSIREKALSGFRWTAGARLTSQLITWSITLIVIRILEPSDYGLLAMATVFVSLLAMFSELGLGAAIVQRAEMDQSLVKRVFAVVLLVHFAVAALLFLSAPLIGTFYGEPRIVPVLRVLSAQFVLGAFAVIPDALLQRQMEFKRRSLLDLGSAILTSVTTLTLALGGAGVWSLVIGSLVGQVCKTVGLNWISPFLNRPEFTFTGMQSLLRFGGHITATQLLWMMFSQADILICAKLLGNEVLGFYAVALHLASLPNQRISGLVNQVAFPAFSSMQHDVQRVGTNMLLGVRILSFVAFPILWGISSLAPEIVVTVLGEKWIPSTVTLQTLALVMPLRMVANFVQVAVQGVGRSDVLLRNAIWGVTIGPPMFFFGVQFGGLLGLSLAWLVVSPLVFLQGVWRGLPTLGMGLRSLFKAIAPAAMTAVVMYGSIALTRQVLSQGLPMPVRFAILIAIGAAVYLLIAWFLNRKGALEFLTVWRSLGIAKNKE